MTKFDHSRSPRSINQRWVQLITVVFSFWLFAITLSAAPCPRTNSEQRTWAAAKVNVLVRSAYAAYKEENTQRHYERVVDEIARTITRCGLDEDREFLSHYPEFIEYVKLLSLPNQDDHELGFLVSDQTYFRETREFVKIPDFLLNPKFLRAVSRFESLPQAKALLRQMNAARTSDEQLLFFSYSSRHLGTPDNPDSFRRLLIVVPGNAATNQPEKWVQFGITDPEARAHVRNVSVVAAVPGSEGTTNFYFKDYFRTYHRDGSITIAGRWEMGYGDDNCALCHKSGVLPIFPDAGSVKRDEMQMVERVNQRFLTYRKPRFDKYLDASKFGPGLGSMDAENVYSRARFSKRIAESSVSCSSCHRPNGLGSLNWPMDEVLIQSFVTGGVMPLNVRLQHSERAVLYKKLIDDYFSVDDAHPGILKAWLVGKSR